MVSQADYAQFLKDFFNDLYPSQRLGQAFMSKFNVHNDQHLFYLRSVKGAKTHIEKTYLGTT